MKKQVKINLHLCFFASLLASSWNYQPLFFFQLFLTQFGVLTVILYSEGVKLTLMSDQIKQMYALFLLKKFMVFQFCGEFKCLSINIFVRAEFASSKRPRNVMNQAVPVLVICWGAPPLQVITQLSFSRPTIVI